MKNKTKQPWIYTAISDGIFILSPPFLVLLVILLFPHYFTDGAAVSPVAWIILVLCIDVAHVYSTLYRTYFDKETFRSGKNLFLLTPLCVFIFGVLLFSVSAHLFWRVAAYLAVFHFIRQQYGFLKIYSRKENRPRFSRVLDSIFIYTLTAYPILWWHMHGPREFSWFVENDFMFFKAPFLEIPLQVLYWGIAGIWLVLEALHLFKTKLINIPRILLVAGTGLSWYYGIIVYNGDLVFTALNVISHGIPYMALVWMYGNKKYRAPRPEETRSLFSFIFRPRNILLFAGAIIFIAYVEEALWDKLVWNDHPQYFSFLHFIPKPDDFYLAFIVPLLAVPQLTHYVLDGFIWKMKKDEFKWKESTLDQ